MHYHLITSESQPDPVAPRPMALDWAWRGGIVWARLVCWLTEHSPTPLGPTAYTCRDCGARATWRWL